MARLHEPSLHAMAIEVGRLCRRHVISRSGLEAVLKDLKDREFPSAISRQTVKRQRDTTVEVQTPLGCLLSSYSVTLPEQKKTAKKPAMKAKSVELPFLAPLPLLYHLCAQESEFARMMRHVLDRYKPSRQQPLSILAYADEISPGNVLAHRLERKVQVIYWSIKEFGPVALSSERCWFLAGIARSEHVKRLPGKMSEYFRRCLEQFILPIDVREGIQVRFADGHCSMLFAAVDVIVADEVALKEMIDMKGAAGTICCPLCRNLVDHKSELHHHQDAFVPSTTIDLSLVDAQTDASVKKILDYLEEQAHGPVSKAKFSKMTQALGFNYNPHGLLRSAELDIKAVSVLMFDWMHCFCVAGLWNVEAGLLVAKLQEIGITQADLHEELQKFIWPQAIRSRGVTGQKIFAKGDQNEDIKCSASECLSVYSVIRFFLLEAMQTQNLRAIRAECESYFRLCHVLDLLQQVKLGKTTPRALEVAVVAHLSAFKDAYRDTRFLPKHHYSLHLCRMLQRHGTLVSCFCHERKHKEIKRHAQLICNTWSAWERSVMVDAACDMLDSLLEDQDQSFYGGICQPQEAPMATKQLLYRTLGAFRVAKVARSAYYAPGARVFKDDVVICHVEDLNDPLLGQVLFFASVDDAEWVCLQPWEPLGSNIFNCEGLDPVLFGLECIRDTCIFKPMPENQAAVAACSTWASW